MRSQARQGATSVDLLSPADADALLRQARALVEVQTAAPKLMAGKQLALLSPECSDVLAQEFVQAATALGARVAFVQPGLDEHSSPSQIDALARVLGRLYDAVECQHLPAPLVQRIARSAGIPVFTGLATAEHPTATLVDEMDGALPRQARRRSILQAALLVGMP